MLKARKITAFVSAIALVMACMVMSAAAYSPEISDSAMEPSEPVFTVLEQTITPRGQVLVISFSIPGDGSYYVMNDFTGEYSDGTKITVKGTWSPSYEPIRVSFEDIVHGGSMDSLVDSGETRSFMLWDDSDWTLSLMSNAGAGRTISGTLQVTIG